MTLRLSWPEFVQVLAQGREEAAHRYQQAARRGDNEAAAIWASELKDWDKLLAACDENRPWDGTVPADQTGRSAA